MSHGLGFQDLKLNFLYLFLIFIAAGACTNTFHAYHSDHLPGRLKVVAVPGSCYYYVKDTLTGLCWLSCFDQSMIADEDCKYYDKAFAGRKLDGKHNGSDGQTIQNSKEVMKK